MRMATKQRCKHRINFVINVSLLYLRRFAMRVKHVLKLLNQTTTSARKVKCGCGNIQSTPNSHMAATDLHAQPYGNCHQKIYFKYVFTAIAQGCISCGVLLSGTGARGVSSEHMENMEMFSCSPT